LEKGLYDKIENAIIRKVLKSLRKEAEHEKAHEPIAKKQFDFLEDCINNRGRELAPKEKAQGSSQPL